MFQFLLAFVNRPRDSLAVEVSISLTMMSPLTSLSASYVLD